MEYWSDGVVELWSVGSIRITASLQYSNTPIRHPQLKFIWLALCPLLFALSFPAEAQQPKVPRIGFLSAGSASTYSPRDEAFRQGLRDLGYAEGKNITIEYRFAEGKVERLPDLATQLVQLKVDVIVTSGVPQLLAAKQATTTIPIVGGSAGDLVGAGLVASLARPGGSIGGVAAISGDVVGKQLELLRE